MMLFTLIFLLAAGSVSTSCEFEPFQVPIQDVQLVSNISGAVMRGIPATIGTPPQQIALLPWPELDNTYTYNPPGLCDGACKVEYCDDNCQVRRGNLFIEDDSTSWALSSTYVEALGAFVETGNANSPDAGKGIEKLAFTSLAGTDKFQVESSGLLSKFPIGIPLVGWDYGNSYMHPLGLGKNSTYLNALLASRRIGSRVWSVFWGRMWTYENPLDGAIVFGGYDKRKATGINHTQALDYSASGCWTDMKVSVSDVQVNLKNGTNQSLFSPSMSLKFCIVPQNQLLMEIPATFYHSFLNFAGLGAETNETRLSTRIHSPAHIFRNGKFDGDITIQLDSGLEIRVASDQYIVPQVILEPNKTRTINYGRREVLIASIGEDLPEQLATLGRYFLTGAYLMVNQEAGSFTIWQANATSSSELVSVLDEKSASRCADKAAGGQPAPPGISNPTQVLNRSATAPFEKSRVRIIGGAVSGAKIFLCISAGLAIYLIQRSRPVVVAKFRRLRQAPSNRDAMNPQPAELEDSRVSELPGHQPGPELEVGGSRDAMPEMQDLHDVISEMPVDKYLTPYFHR